MSDVDTAESQQTLTEPYKYPKTALARTGHAPVRTSTNQQTHAHVRVKKGTQKYTHARARTHAPTRSFRVWNEPVEWQLATILQPWQPAP